MWSGPAVTNFLEINTQLQVRVFHPIYALFFLKDLSWGLSRAIWKFWWPRGLYIYLYVRIKVLESLYGSYVDSLWNDRLGLEKKNIHVIYISEEIVLEINYTLDLKFPFIRKNIVMIFYRPDDGLNMILIWFKKKLLSYILYFFMIKK